MALMRYLGPWAAVTLATCLCVLAVPAEAAAAAAPKPNSIPSANAVSTVSGPRSSGGGGAGTTVAG